MSTLKETRDRISSISSIMKITSAMKMVSAAKLKKSQRESSHLRLYFNYLEGTYKKLVAEKKRNSAFNESQKRLDSSKDLFILIGSNRGLCGSFNNFILKEIENGLKESYFLTIGKKIYIPLSKKYKIYQDKSELLDNLSLETCNLLIKELKKKYKKGFFKSIKLIYNYPKSTSVSEVKIESLFSENEDLDKAHFKPSSDYFLEPLGWVIFENLKDQIKKISLYKALIESSTAEHASRMLAMHKATENATELKSELSLIYNKVRQASITKEIIEISSQT